MWRCRDEPPLHATEHALSTRRCEAKLTEAAVNRLPDGSWLAINRQENRDQNYMFAASPDGRTWTPHEYRPHVANGTNSKPVFGAGDRCGDSRCICRI